MNLVYKLFKPLVSVIYLNGNINPRMQKYQIKQIDQYNRTDIVTRQLKTINVSRTKALAVVINSKGGQPLQCDLICDKLLHFTKSNNIALYTFADDFALSGGYYILCIGDKVFASNTSLLGSIGLINRHINIKGVLLKQGIEFRKFVSNENMYSSLKTEYFEPFDSESHKKYQPVYQEMHQQFKKHVINFRQNKIINDQQIQDLIFNGQIFNGDEGKQNGLIDNIGSYQNTIQQLHSDCAMHHIATKSTRQIISESLFSSNLLDLQSKSS